MADLALRDVEISCDGPGCQTATLHSLWAVSDRAACTKARHELVHEHGWARVVMHSVGQPPHPVDLCPRCKTRLVHPTMKETRCA